ncbi:MAG: hypothetical protein ACOCZP_03160 [Candidatus Hadarchaeota archaeon]
MKAKLAPVYFKDAGMNEKFNEQLERLKDLLEDEADILKPFQLGTTVPDEADAVLFPQLLGEAYERVEEIQEIDKPRLILTSEFGTFAMWDWEIITFMRSKGIEMIAPYDISQTKMLCDALKAKRKLSQSKFIVYQDKPGEDGQQDPIFKRFYWWEDDCIDKMEEKFGLAIDKRSFKELGTRAQNKPDSDVKGVLDDLTIDVSENLTNDALIRALKVYQAVKEDVEEEGSVAGVGINCLNESKYSDTTPCLAWNLLYEEKELIWACEGDIMTLITEYLVNKTLDAPVMMSNIYPFLMGRAALDHEGIPNFPEIVDNPDDHILMAHCGYLGVLPESFSTEWTLRPKVLEIVDDNSHAIDARFPEGEVTLVKVGPSMEKIMAIEGNLKGYVQYPGTDCRNGAIIEVEDGHEVMNRAYSHHQILVPGHRGRDIETIVGKIMDLEVEVL